MYLYIYLISIILCYHHQIIDDQLPSGVTVKGDSLTYIPEVPKNVAKNYC